MCVCEQYFWLDRVAQTIIEICTRISTKIQINVNKVFSDMNMSNKLKNTSITLKSAYEMVYQINVIKKLNAHGI